MSGPLTENPGGEKSMSSVAGSPVRTLAPRAKEQGSTGPDRDSGLKWRASLAKYDPISSSWKIPQCLFQEGWDEFSGTWPRWGTMRNGVCWEQSMPGHLIDGNESGLWVPTPNASDHITRKTSKSWKAKGRVNFVLSNPEIQATWPTPIASDWKPNGPNSKQQNLASVVRMFPTPTCQDAKNNGAPSQMESNSLPLNAAVGGSLNPDWTEWLMGWCPGWTDLKPLATDKFRQWFDSHGKRSQAGLKTDEATVHG